MIGDPRNLIRVTPAKGAIVATVTERLERALEREAPSWDIRPVPPEHRRLRGLDFAVLWGDLSVGLLVLLTGALLVPALGFREALLAIVVGSVLGCIPLALVGLAGAREGVPGTGSGRLQWSGGPRGASGIHRALAGSAPGARCAGSPDPGRCGRPHRPADDRQPDGAADHHPLNPGRRSVS